MKRIRILIWSLFFLVTSPITLLAQNSWQQLFNGETLDGWTQLNGDAEYRVENNAIVGRAVPDTPNSFLINVGYPIRVDVDAAKQHFLDDGWTMYDTMYATFKYDDNIYMVSNVKWQ